MKVIKATLKHMLLNALGGEEPTPSYSELCTVLVMVANVVNKLPVALRYSTGTLACSSWCS